ncbi:hypothetical protein [Aeromonas encheleia]|uniref:Uncharacterized protein n=1 Tax=Aeromonas encheleia TaxID=73010 RepID=A0AAE9ML09_9GAMM|nr:hypothetical protein [Aeromonas encheleia]USV59642.1 hypothetical protein NHF51_06175 [Aeromonas encheleia]
MSIWRPETPDHRQHASGQAKGICNYLHANPYYLDDDCLLIGAQIFVNLATRNA